MMADRIERFYSLDVLRGVAALGVVLWHWQHFFFLGSRLGPYDASQAPLYKYLFLFYDKGWLGVDLFFSLSGFVFFWLYSSRISGSSITAGRFAWLRFSRLYPLHILTLLLVIAELAVARAAGKGFFVYPDNDLKHFLLNLVFAASWGAENGQSFNGPFWSVSVEVFLYGLFFTFCRLLPVRPLFLLLLSLSGYFLLEPHYLPLGRGICSFFLGGGVYLLYSNLLQSKHLREVTWGVVCFAVAGWVLTTSLFAAGFDVTAIQWQSAHVQKNIGRLPMIWVTMVLFPATILALALAETCRGSLGRRIAMVGDISYSCYLIHFPLQFAFYLALSYFGISSATCYTAAFMSLFFSLLIPLSLASYHFLELPCQTFLRGLRWKAVVQPWKMEA
jgi:peptidoglycan/LPS O-acetylase OafA/YrhL